MKRAVSISIGSSKRNKAVEIELLGEHVSLERIGTDGDMEKAAQLYQEMDGQVDAFGVGGADLGMMVDQKWYPIHSAQKLVRFVKKTPVVDGTGLKNTLENQVAGFIERNLGGYVKDKKVFITMGLDRWGTTISFVNADYEVTFGDFMFALGIPIPLHSIGQLKFLAAVLVPIVTRLPFEWLYPTGEKQEIQEPKWEKYYQWASVIAGDCHYIKRHMPYRMDGKVIVTNTTTSDDITFFKKAGIKYLITSTPVLEGRSFGTNMMEAALIAVSGKGRVLTNQELNEMIAQLKLEPQLQEL